MTNTRVKKSRYKKGKQEQEVEQERMVDAQALGDDEGRGKLRKAAGSCKRALIRRCPNGGTRLVEDQTPARKGTRGTETSKYPEEKRTIVIPRVVASESGGALKLYLGEQKYLERYTVGGDSPVDEE